MLAVMRTCRGTLGKEGLDKAAPPAGGFPVVGKEGLVKTAPPAGGFPVVGKEGVDKAAPPTGDPPTGEMFGRAAMAVGLSGGGRAKPREAVSRSAERANTIRRTGGNSRGLLAGYMLVLVGETLIAGNVIDIVRAGSADAEAAHGAGRAVADPGSFHAE